MFNVCGKDECEIGGGRANVLGKLSRIGWPHRSLARAGQGDLT